MKKLQVQEGLQKIAQGEPSVPPGDGATVVQQRKEKERKDKMERLFEEEILLPPSKVAQTKPPSVN